MGNAYNSSAAADNGSVIQYSAEDGVEENIPTPAST